MFLHLSVSHSVHMGEAWPREGAWSRGVCSRGGAWSRGVSAPGERGGAAPRGVQTSPPQTATVADGTHPTGMHSCLPENIAF